MTAEKRFSRGSCQQRRAPSLAGLATRHATIENRADATGPALMPLYFDGRASPRLSIKAGSARLHDAEGRSYNSHITGIR